jgi:short-subunit dehydrogenase
MCDIFYFQTATINSTLKSFDMMGADKGGSGGTVVNVSSLLALKRTPHLPVFTSTKLAVLQFSNSIGVSITFSRDPGQ